MLWEVCFNGFARMKNSDVGVSPVKAGGDYGLSILSWTMSIKLLGVRDGQRLSRVRRSKASSKK